MTLKELIQAHPDNTMLVYELVARYPQLLINKLHTTTQLQMAKDLNIPTSVMSILGRVLRAQDYTQTDTHHLYSIGGEVEVTSYD